VYGDPRHYLLVAAANRLDDFRSLSPGQELRFPPVDLAGAVR
jgi:nucleoid-associated protein YgaU